MRKDLSKNDAATSVSARAVEIGGKIERLSSRGVKYVLSAVLAILLHPQLARSANYDAALTALPGLISYWDLNETSGTTAADSVTGDLIDGDNSGTYSGTGITVGSAGPRPSDGWTGFASNNYAPEFSKAADQRLEMPSISGYTGLTDLTMLGWIKITDPNYTSNSNHYGGLQKSTGGRYVYAINSYPGNVTDGFIGRDDGGSQNQIVTDLPPTPNGINEWRFFAQTFEAGTTNTLYLNGVEAQSVSGAALGLFPAETMVFGNDIGDGARALHGQLDELAFFDRALSTSEIEGLFVAAGGSLPGSPGSTATAPYLQTAQNLGGLINHWNFAETTGTSAADVASGNNGTFVNALGSPDLTAAGPNPSVSHQGVSMNGFAADNSAVEFATGVNYMEPQNGQGVGDPISGTAFADGISELTMSLWFKASDGADGGVIAGFEQNSGTRYNFLTQHLNAQDVNFWAESDNGQQISSPGIEIDADPNDYEWHHLVQVWDGAEKRLRAYVDGVEKFNATNASMSENLQVPDGFYVGFDVPISDRKLEGSVDELMLFDRALTAGEVLELYDSAFVPIPEPATCVLVMVAGVSLCLCRRNIR